MSELANYSIETDQTVLLSFKDGRRRRVAISELPRHLNTTDLEKIKSALRLRRDFIQQHMPKALVLAVAGSALAIFVVGGQVVASLQRHDSPLEPAHERTQIVHELPTEATVTPAVPSPQFAARPVVKKVSVRATAAVARPKPTPSPTATPAPTPAPSTTPEPSPTPTATPEPIADNGSSGDTNQAPRGEVLGESTGPVPTPPPQN